MTGGRLTLATTLSHVLVVALCVTHLSLAERQRRYRHVSRPWVVSPSRGEAWPRPMKQTTGPNLILLNPSTFTFMFVGPPGGCHVVDQALKRYRDQLLFNGCAGPRGEASSQTRVPSRGPVKGLPVAGINSLLVRLRGPCQHMPHNDMDEAYTLELTLKSHPSLEANSVWGLLRGLETFSQIVYPYDGFQFAVNETVIHDAPRFQHRGLLIDTSRHFLPLKKIVETLDAMAYNKMNVLHWHMTDDQSFPFVSRTFPTLSERGAYDPETHVYRPADVQYVIGEAAARGIRVMVEFDTPGHTLSWGQAYPELLTTCYTGDAPNGELGPLDPTRKETYVFMAHFFAEVARVFPDQYLHLGGDEVSFDCWQSNPNITSFMRRMGLSSRFDKLEEHYIQRLLEIIQTLRKSYVVWQEVFDNNVTIAPDTVVHVWKPPQNEELASVTSAGYRALLSACWYLDYISYGADWKKYYACDPHNFRGSPQQKTLVIGGEVCLWSEYIDATNIISRAWPRASAAAERLWSPATVNSVEEAAPRLEEHRCRMRRRGLMVEPQNGPGFCDCDNAI
ncbi:beta-hexosaminidase subunit alpha-like [Dermacentor silvarum]|uniref:beta-hexosaminidase subunit alpha-like n=1 Tax=Dermacentor silvarum TaxID=543639 RepID=UPI001897AF96|nr:beta-hexosaminidase subunit alpha-like [Dermacentor silvarum]